MAPNDTAYKRWNCHSWYKLLCKLCRNLPLQQWGLDLPFLGGGSQPCGTAGWLALLLRKAGDVETNPGPTSSHRRVWIRKFCNKQIHVRKQIYTDTWTCHLHRESRLTFHTDITPRHPYKLWSKPPTHSLLPTYTTYTTLTIATQTHTRPAFPLFAQDW